MARIARMKLLIVTQAVDSTDPVLGFFVRWIEEFAKHTEQLEVICLKKGVCSLPGNVRVHSLGKERGAASRFTYAPRFLVCIWKLRKDYDAVFVHMNPEYVVLGGIFWRLWHKRIVLWYTHKSVNLKLRIATLLTNIILTASKESFRLRSKKVKVTGHGIDTDFFSPDQNVKREGWYLSVGRLMPSKDHKMAIAEAKKDGKIIRIVGEGPERTNLEEYAHSVDASVEFLGPGSQEGLRDEYRRAKLLIHTSKTGSLDKVVLEALACGLPVRTSDPALKHLENESPEYIQKHHSLQNLIPEILESIVRDTVKP